MPVILVQTSRLESFHLSSSTYPLVWPYQSQLASKPFQTSSQLPVVLALLYSVARVSKKLLCSGPDRSGVNQGSGCFLPTLKIDLSPRLRRRKSIRKRI